MDTAICAKPLARWMYGDWMDFAGSPCLMAYTVARRTNEIGIRLALGAQRWQVMTMVVSEALWLVILGIVAGIVAALLLTRFFSRCSLD